MDIMKSVFPGIANLFQAWRLNKSQAKPRDVYALLVRGMDDKSPVNRQGSLEKPCESPWVYSGKDHQFLDNMKSVFPGIANFFQIWRLNKIQANSRNIYALLVRGMDDKSPVYRQGYLKRPRESSWVYSKKDHQFMDNMKFVFPGIPNLVQAWRLNKTQAKPRNFLCLPCSWNGQQSPVYRQGSLERPCESSWVHSGKDHQFMDNMKSVFLGIANLFQAWLLKKPN